MQVVYEKNTVKVQSLMLQFQRYIFSSALRSFLLIISVLGVLALLSQGLTWLDILSENHQNFLVYGKITLLSAPKVFCLIIPPGLYLACLVTMRRFHANSEIAVVQATGMTHWQIASPLLRLASFVVIVHLIINLWIQPTAQRQLREALLEARTDVAALLLQAGQFTTTQSGLTVYTREREGNELRNLMISDASDPDQPIDYLAQFGQITALERGPAIILEDGEIHQEDAEGVISIITFDQYLIDLSPFQREDTDTVLKASDRYLDELLNIDETHYVDVPSRADFQAEAHHRLTDPLLNIAAVLIALLASLSGEYRKKGYGRQISLYSGAIFALILLHILLRSEAGNLPALNIGLWILPLFTIGLAALTYFSGHRLKPLFKSPVLQAHAEMDPV